MADPHRSRVPLWAVVGAVAAVLGAGVATVRRLARVEVTGASMLPTLAGGDRLVVVGGLRAACPGDLVVVPDPREPKRLLVKRVAAISPEGLEVAGDNPEASTDSRSFGTVPAAAVVGRPVYRYWPPERAGRLQQGGRRERAGRLQQGGRRERAGRLQQGGRRERRLLRRP